MKRWKKVFCANSKPPRGSRGGCTEIRQNRPWLDRPKNQKRATHTVGHPHSRKRHSCTHAHTQRQTIATRGAEAHGPAGRSRALRSRGEAPALARSCPCAVPVVTWIAHLGIKQSFSIDPPLLRHPSLCLPSAPFLTLTSSACGPSLPPSASTACSLFPWRSRWYRPHCN